MNPEPILPPCLNPASRSNLMPFVHRRTRIFETREEDRLIPQLAAAARASEKHPELPFWIIGHAACETAMFGTTQKTELR